MPPSFLFNWMRKTGPFLTHVDPFHRKMVRNQKLGHFVVRLDRSFSTRFEKLTRFKLNGFQSPFWPFSIEKKVTQNVLFETRSHRFLVNKISKKTKKKKQNKTKRKKNATICKWQKPGRHLVDFQKQINTDKSATDWIALAHSVRNTRGYNVMNLNGFLGPDSIRDSMGSWNTAGQKRSSFWELTLREPYFSY